MPLMKDPIMRGRLWMSLLDQQIRAPKLTVEENASFNLSITILMSNDIRRTCTDDEMVLSANAQ